jgi:predicted RNA-binding protein YlxR (DUF448 family)
VKTLGGVAAGGGRGLPGRGAYVCANLACVKAAKKKRGFERSLKAAADCGFYAELAELAGRVGSD